MRSKHFRRSAAWLTAFLLFSGCRVTAATPSAHIESAITAAIGWKQSAAGVSSSQALLDTGLAKTAGTSPTEWYVLALNRYDGSLSLSGFGAALEQYLSGNPVKNATEQQRLALTACSAGICPDFARTVAANATGKLGVMSRIYGILLNDTLGQDTAAAVQALLEAQLPDGGWALSGDTADADITAMALQALAAHRSTAAASIDRGLACLAALRQADGGYLSAGKPTAESCAQVVSALCALGIDPGSDTRFLRDGRSVTDALLDFQLGSGGFSHLTGGKENDQATAQSLCALVALWRLQNDKSGFYPLNNRLPQATTTGSTAVPATTAVTTAPGRTTTATAATTATESTAAITTASAAVAATTTASSPATTNVSAKRGNVPYKTVIIVVACGMALAAMLVLIRRKQATRYSLALLAVGLTAVILLTLFVRIQSVDSYYREHAEDVSDSTESVTLSIRCDTAVTAGYTADPVILQDITLALREGDTVFSLLQRACAVHRLQLDYSRSGAGDMYIKGIGDLYEFSCGELSGWLFTVNGSVPGTSSGNTLVQNGDRICWVYTCALGRDLGEGGSTDE